MSMETDLSTVTEAMLDYLNKSRIGGYLVAPAAGIDLNAIFEYWCWLEKADTLKYRWADSVDPTAMSITDYCTKTPNIYFVVDVATRQLVAEFALGHFMGKAAQVHFSMIPGNEPSLNVFLAEEVTNMILHQWKDVKDLEQSYLDTLFGVTPVDNRVACMFIRKAGFKAIGTLVSGADYLGEVTDALLTTKSRIV